MDCLFCEISKKNIKSDIVYEDSRVMAFNDTNPKAPTHILVIPFKHIETLNEISEEDASLMGHMVYVASQLAKENGVEKNGYRLIYNTNRGAGQSVFHVHLHILGGRLFEWPPG